MGGSGGGSKGTSTTTNNIPPELSGLTSQTAGKIAYAQDLPEFSINQFGAPKPINVPGLSGNQQRAISGAQNIGAMPQGEGLAYGSLADAEGYAGQSSLPYASQSGRATGGTLATDPSIAAAFNAFQSQVKPGIESDYGLMGLGRSTHVGDAVSRGAASQMLPVIQASLAREQAANEARIGREMGAEEGRIGRQTSTSLNQAGQYAGLGGADVNRRLAELNALLTTGGLQRGVEGEQASADYQDMLRRQSLAEQATFGTLGQTPSSLGSQVTSKTSGGSK